MDDSDSVLLYLALYYIHHDTKSLHDQMIFQLGVFPEFKVLKGGDNLIAYKANPDVETTRYSCKNCGSFCYKILAGGGNVAPLGALKGGPAVKPTCHIFVADKGEQAVMFPELPQHDAFP